MLISEILSLYMASIRNKPSFHVDKYLQKRFNTLWGDIDHSDFTVKPLNQYKAKRLREVKTGTVRREMSLIKRAWRYCQSEGHELTDLFYHFRMPPSGNTVRRIPTESELKALIQYCSPQVSALIQLGIETCCRRNEMLNITKECVDFRARTLFLPKAKTGPRIVPLSSKAIRILKKWDCNFTIKPYAVSSNVLRVCKRLDIKGLCFHSITRHYGTTRLIERGFSLSEAATVTGHKDPSMLHRYTHLSPTALAKRLG